VAESTACDGVARHKSQQVKFLPEGWNAQCSWPSGRDDACSQGQSNFATASDSPRLLQADLPEISKQIAEQVVQSIVALQFAPTIAVLPAFAKNARGQELNLK
jgi:hypothetical protein